MLKPRPLKSPATRARTPNSFSTRTEMVWRIRSVWAVAVEDLHDLVLARELELLEALLLDLLLGGEVHLLLVGGEALLEIEVPLVVLAQVGLAVEELLVGALVRRRHRRKLLVAVS